MSSAEPPSPWTRREEIGERVADAPGLLVCLDFDGTLAPIVEEPDAASAPPPIRRAVGRLADRERVEAAVVSGRSLDDLRERVEDLRGHGGSDLQLAGNHGLELDTGDETIVRPEAAGHRETIDRVCRALGDQLTAVPGVRIENKGLTATVHVRQTPDEYTDEVAETVRETVAAINPDLAVTTGKAVLEIRPPVDWDKGRAVEFLLDRAPSGWLPVYAGDDTTDEDAFEALADRGITVKVGGQGQTAADYRLDGQEEVLDLLDLLDEHRPTA